MSAFNSPLSRLEIDPRPQLQTAISTRARDQAEAGAVDIQIRRVPDRLVQQIRRIRPQSHCDVVLGAQHHPL